jgi:hypothetical protein
MQRKLHSEFLITGLNLLKRSVLSKILLVMQFHCEQYVKETQVYFLSFIPSNRYKDESELWLYQTLTSEMSDQQTIA